MREFLLFERIIGILRKILKKTRFFFSIKAIAIDKSSRAGTYTTRSGDAVVNPRNVSFNVTEDSIQVLTQTAKSVVYASTTIRLALNAPKEVPAVESILSINHDV